MSMRYYLLRSMKWLENPNFLRTSKRKGHSTLSKAFFMSSLRIMLPPKLSLFIHCISSREKPMFSVVDLTITNALCALLMISIISSFSLVVSILEKILYETLQILKVLKSTSHGGWGLFRSYRYSYEERKWGWVLQGRNQLPYCKPLCNYIPAVLIDESIEPIWVRYTIRGHVKNCHFLLFIRGGMYKVDVVSDRENFGDKVDGVFL